MKNRRNEGIFIKRRKLEYISIDEIKFYERNTRTHSDDQIEQIVQSIQEFGFTNPVLIDENNVLIAGHGRTVAARTMGMTEVPAIRLTGLSETQRKALRIADNQLALNAGWDEELLKIELSELQDVDFNLDLLGFDMSELDDLLQGLGFEPEPEQYREVEEDEPPTTNVQARCKRGDIWQLGNHRLMCGDSTNKETVAMLMGGNKADISFTSPPYNVGHNIGYKNKDSKYVNNDDNNQNYLSFLEKFTNNAMLFSDYTFVNIQQLANNKVDLIDYLNKFKFSLADTIIWDKGHGTPAMAHKVLTSCFEFIYVFSEKATRAIGTKDFHGTINNIIRIPAQRNNEYSDIHNATFPIALPFEIIVNFTNDNNAVLDLFGGTGTTLIACEQLNRQCYMMELDEHYCDVIIQRWENHTGNKAKRITQATTCA